MTVRGRIRAALLTPLGLTSLLILTTVAFLVAFAPLLWGDAADAIDVAGAGAGLSREHPLGTDALGRDLLARVLVATRSSIVLAVLATLLAAGIGVPAGALPVLFGRRVQRGAAAAIGLLAAFPAVLLALFTIAIVGSERAGQSSASASPVHRCSPGSPRRSPRRSPTRTSWRRPGCWVFHGASC
jgi:ABC-type dipeptide/oligopeptide/nickel transport system permease subunit